MKKGISLIVLVITIIVMIIIAGAIIISLNSSNVISRANEAVTDSDLANARNACMLAWADKVTGNDGIAKDDAGLVVTAEYYYTYLKDSGFGETENDVKAKYDITVNTTNGVPKVDPVGTTTATNG